MSSSLVAEFFRDLAYGVRGIRKRPLLPLLAIATLAVGVGGSAAIFSVVNGTVLKPMMVPEMEKLVRIDDAVLTPSGPSDDTNMAPAFAEALLDRQTAFSAVTIQQAAFFTWTGGAEPERLRGSAVSKGWLETLRIAPIAGRFFTEEELAAGPDSGRALISWSLWQRRFEGRDDAIGRVLVLNGRSRTIVGILPEGFRFPYEAEVWVPIRYDPTDAQNHYLLTFGRLRPDRTMASAQAELAAISDALQPGAAAGATRFRMIATPLRENLIRGFDRSATLLFAVAGALWLLACVNVAGLAVARLSAREGELVVRTALGASRWRQARQLAAEMLLLVFAGSALGLLFAVVATPSLGVLVPPVMSVELAQNELSVDFRVVLFTLGITLVAALAIAVLPALVASRVDLASRLRDSGRSGRGRHSGRFGSSLVVAEMATAMMLLSVAGGILLSFRDSHGGPLGYRPSGVLSFAVNWADSTYPDAARRREATDRLLERLRSVPGATAVGASTLNPRLDPSWDVVAPTSGPRAQVEPPTVAHVGFVSAGFAEALDLERIEGRLIEATDRAGTQPAAVITDDLARTLWPGADLAGALGQSLRVGADPNGEAMTVVGIVRRVRQSTRPQGTVFLALSQAAFAPREIDLYLRSESDPLALLPSVRSAVAAIDPEVPLFRIARLDQVSSPEYLLERAGAVLGGAFGTFGTLLAAIGVLGVLSNAIQARLREFALRKAVGAAPAQVRAQIVAHALRLAGLGIAAGLLANAALGAFLRRLVPAATPLELPHYAALALALGLVGVLSALHPAWRAGRADPAELLRSS